MASTPTSGAAGPNGSWLPTPGQGPFDPRTLQALHARYAQMFAAPVAPASGGAAGFAGATGAFGFGGANGFYGATPPYGMGTSFGALLPNPSTPTGNGGFGNQTAHLFGVVAPKLAAKETALQNLRGKIAANETLSQNELLMYQDLMQQQNQLFMFAQNVFSSEHEKIKSWAQALGSLGR